MRGWSETRAAVADLDSRILNLDREKAKASEDAEKAAARAQQRADGAADLQKALGEMSEVAAAAKVATEKHRAEVQRLEEHLAAARA